MPPTPQATQLTGQKQSQQQYDPSTGPPVQNAASLHTPPPQLPARLPPATVPATALSSTLQFSQQSQVVETPTQLQIPVKTPQLNAPIPAPLPSQLAAPSPQPAQPTLHVPMTGKAQMQTSQLSSQTQVLCGHWLFWLVRYRRKEEAVCKDGLQFRYLVVWSALNQHIPWSSFTCLP